MSLFRGYLSILLLALASLSGCIDIADGGSNPIGTLTGSNNLGGVAASGAPLSKASVTVKSVTGAIIATATTNDAAFFQVALDPASAPSILEVTDTSVSPPVTLTALVLKDDVTASGGNVNITPISTIVAKLAVNEGIVGKTDSDIKAIRTNAAVQVKKSIQPLLDAMNVTDTADQLLTRQFVPTQDPLDKVLDTFTVACTAASCAINPVSETAKKVLAGSPLVLNVSSIAAASAGSTQLATKLATVKTVMAASAPVVVVFSYSDKSGTRLDSWAGYNGTFAIYNFSDSPVNGGSQLYFKSSKLKSTGFYNAAAVADGSGGFLFTLPSWASLAPLGAQGKPVPYGIGFTGKGVPEDLTDLSDCNFNGQKCLVLIDDGKLVGLDQSDAAIKVRSWAQFLVTLPPQVQAMAPAPVVPPPAVAPGQTTVQAPPAVSDVPTSAKATLLANATSSWVGGFNGAFELKNTSSERWTGWSLRITVPSGVTRVTSWGNYKMSTAGSVVSFSNESWNGTLAAADTIKINYGGEGALTQIPTNCEVAYNGGAYTPCTVSLGASSPVSIVVSTTVLTVPVAGVAPVVTSASTATAATTSSSTSTAITGSTSTGATASTASTSLVGSTGTIVLTSSSNAPGATIDSSGPATTGADEPQTMADAKSATLNKRVYVGYYPSWSDNWFSSTNFDGSASNNDAILKKSKLARAPAVYTHVVASFAQPNFSYTTAGNFTAKNWAGTGLNFNAAPKDIKRAIEVLHARNIKVLLAVGGATYNDWAALAAEGGTGGPITTALKQIMVDIGFDGLDVDYEVEGAGADRISEYTGAVNAMRNAVTLAGSGRILSLAGWSTGADCTSATGTTAAACGGKSSYWSGSAGRERLVFAQPGMAAKIDMLSIMSYDARYEHYDGVKAWQLYRDLFPSTTVVNIGLESSPEGWAGGMLVVRDADALCDGSTVLKDQFGAAVNLPYSVERYAKAVTTARANSNPRDGAMLWQILKTATAACGASVVASPRSIANMIGDLYGIQKDDRAAWK